MWIFLLIMLGFLTKLLIFPIIFIIGYTNPIQMSAIKK